MAWGKKTQGSGQQDGTFKRIGSLWEGEDRKGNPTLRGSVQKAALIEWLEEIDFENRDDEAYLPIIVLGNSYKEKENQPDFNIYGKDPDQKGKRPEKKSGFGRRKEEPEEKPEPRQPSRKPVPAKKGRSGKRLRLK